MEAIGLAVVRGRGPRRTDDAEAEPVVVVNRTMAEAIWPDEDPIGQRFTMGGPLWYTVVGIAGDERYASLAQPTAPVMYIPFCQGRFGHFLDWGMSLVVRTSGDPAQLVPAVRERVRRVAPALPIFSIAMFDELILEDVAAQQFNAMLFGAFALIALALAAIGVYSLLSYLVGQRSREIVVRMALGARRATILRMVIGRALTFAAMGASLGVIAALALTRLLDSMLFDTAPRDPAAFGAGVAILIAVAIVACAVPALRASRVEPAAALRLE